MSQWLFSAGNSKGVSNRVQVSCIANQKTGYQVLLIEKGISRLYFGIFSFSLELIFFVTIFLKLSFL